MKKIILLLLVLFTTLNVNAQFGRQNGRNNRFGRQQPNTPPSEQKIENMEKKAKAKQQEYIVSFISTLEADDFQKEISKQTIDDYYEKIKGFMEIPFDSSTERKDAFEKFRDEHFKELKSLLSEKDNEKLDIFLEGKFKENNKDKKKKRKRKKQKDNN